MTLVRKVEERSLHTEDDHVRELQAIVEEQQQQLHIQNSLLAELEESRDAVRQWDEPTAEVQRGVVTAAQQRQLEIQEDQLVEHEKV